MNLGKLIGNIISSVAEFGSDHAEELCAGAAILASVGATAIAVKNTYNIASEVEDINSDIHDVKRSYIQGEDGSVEYIDPFNDDDEGNAIVLAGDEATAAYKEDIVDLNRERIVLFIKAYWPALTLEAVTIASVLLGRKVAREKQKDLAAKLAMAQTSIAAIQASYNKYRQNVIDKYGKDEDRNLRLGLHKEKQETEYTDEKGKTKKKKEEIEVQDKSKVADRWVRCFDESSRNWSKDPMVNQDFLYSAESMFNKNLDEIYGFVTANQVYDWLDLPQAEDGQTWGWVRDEDKVHQIDFGIFNIDDQGKRRFVNGYERNCFIDFVNPPTYIGDKVWGKKGEIGIANKKFIGRGCH